MLLGKIIMSLAQSNEFFIQKAIGWALREYSKTDALAVKNFVENNDLPKLSKREALKWLASH
jgi:3-methyladenine DNA glycosylase AlkD